MRKIYMLLLAICFAAAVNAQIPVTVSGTAVTSPALAASYPSLAAALTDLNAVTSYTTNGTIVFTCTGGTSETAPATGLTIGSATLNPLLSSTNTVTIINGGGGPVTLNAGVGTAIPSGAVPDGILKLVGADFITIDGLTFTDGNAANPATMEFGIGLFKLSATDGAQNNTIQNCIITLNRINNASGSGPAVEGSVGIQGYNATETAATTALTITVASGTNSNNKFYTNTIQNCNYGISLGGFASATFGDSGNDIGGVASGTGNQILNYGGAAGATNPAAAVRLREQIGNCNVSYNTIHSNNGGGVNHPSTLRGIFAQSGTSGSINITNNTITVRGGGTTSAVTAIDNGLGSTAAGNTINITNNTITGCTYATATSGTFTGIVNSASAATVNITGNQLTSNSTNATSGTTNLIQSSGAVATALNISSNNINGWTYNAATTTGTLNGINVSAVLPAATLTISSNNFQSITHAVAGATAHVYIIWNHGPAGVTDNINSNTFTNLSVATTGSVTFLSRGTTSFSATGVHNVNSNSIVTAFNKTSAGGTVTFYTNGGGASSPNGAVQHETLNNFSNVTCTGATAITMWSNADGPGGGAGPTKNINNNTFNNITTGAAQITGITWNFSGNGASVSNNTITNLNGGGVILALASGTSNGGTHTVANNTLTNYTTLGQVNAIQMGAATSPIIFNVTNNTIRAISTTGTTNPVFGVIVTGGAATNTTNISKNRIGDLSTTGTGGTMFGVLVQTLGTHNIFNNIIGDLRTPTATGLNAIQGISVGAGVTANVYYNTVYLNATSTSVTTFGTSAVGFSSTASSLTLRNNILYNASTPAQEGLNVATNGVSAGLRRTAGTAATVPANYNTASNNNAYWVNPSAGTNNHTAYVEGTTTITNSQNTVANMKAFMGNRDQNSVEENVSFQSTVVTSPDFLKYNTGSASQVESGALNIATFTDDYIGTIRQGNGGYAGTGSAPDIGAWELEGIAADLTSPSIIYTPLGFTCGTGNRTLNATITDASGVPTAGIGLPVLYWRINAGPYTPATATHMGGSTYQFSFGAGVVVTDVVSYYIVAQDNVGNVGANPGGGAGGFTTNPPAAATPPTTPSSYTINNALTGNYTVGAAGNFLTLADAFAAYNTSCLAGPVVFRLIDASYTNTSDTLRANPDASAINTLTIKTTVAGTTITGNSAQAPIVLHGADYIIIDGSTGSTPNTVCPLSTASRDLTISNTNAGTASAVVSLNTTAAGDPATNNTIMNCIINGNTNTTTSVGINNSGTAIGSGAGANLNNNNSIINNSVNRCAFGIFSAGASTALKNTGTVINLNTLTSSGANSIGRGGIMVLLEDGPTVSGNQIGNIVSTASNDVLAIGIGLNGISTTTLSGGETSNATVTNNTIGIVQQTATFSAWGIGVQASTTGTTLIANNMISGVNANATSGDVAAGIIAGGGTGSTTNIFHNSVTMTGTLTGADEGSYALAIMGTNPVVNVRNNILLSTGSTGANRNRAIGLGFALPASNLVSDNNDLFVSGTGSAIGQTTTIDNSGGVNHATFLDWQTNSGKDANSRNVLPTFVSATDLHLVTPDPTNFNNLESLGAVTSVTNDIDCQTRPNGSAPDIGADEFVGAVPSCNTPTGVSVGSITTTTASVSFTCGGCTGTFIVEYGPPGFTPGTGAAAGGGVLALGGASPIAIGPLTAATTYDVYVRQDCGAGSYSNNSAVVTFTTLCNPVALPYTENFDAVTPPAIPVCSFKQDINGATTWNTSTTNPRSTPNSLTYNWDAVTPGDDWWFTPGLSLTAGTPYRLTFWYRARSSSFPEAMEVHYGNGQNAASMTSGMLFSNTNIVNTTYAQHTFDFTPGSTGVYYIGFHSISLADQFDLHVDDINVDLVPACPAPTGLSVGSVTFNSATATWSGTAPFVLEYGLTGFTPGTGATAGVGGTVINPATSPQLISGLSPSTGYDVYVRQDCTGLGNGYSLNAGPVSFTTPAAPPPNDDAPGAIPLTVGGGCAGNPFTNAAATQSAGEPFAACRGTAGFNTVWYSFVAPASGAVRVSTDFAGGTMGTDSRIALFSTTNVNDYSAFTNIACDDDNGATVSARSILYATGLTGGNTYYIQVDGFSASTTQGTFCLTVDELASSMITTTATACAAGQSQFSQNDNYSGWISAVDAAGNLIALISNQTGGAGTSSFDYSVNINSAAVRTDAVSGQYYLDRNFRITSSTVTNANVRFFFLNTELSALQGVDPAVTLGNLQVTRQTGSGCQAAFVAANGTNSSLAQTANGGGTGYSWVQAATPGLSNFYLNTMRSYVPVRTYLNGAYNAGLVRHKDVTATWAAVLNANALSQPYNIAAFGNYAGTESVAGGFFTSTAATTDVVDWVLLELRDATTPSTIITRRAAFIREDGRIVDLDGLTDVSFRNLAVGNYFVVIRHRNHLGIRTAATQVVDGTMGVAIPPLYDFSTAQAQAFQDAAILALAPPNNNNAMRDVSGVFVMWGGNGNANNTTRASGPLAQNDYGFLVTTTLGGDATLIIPNVYSRADYNMDGQVRASGPLAQNDYGFLLTTTLGGDATRIITQHQ